MSYLHAVILGIVQGLTEFLPVSSSGHLVLFQQYLGLYEDMLTFDVFVHFGTLLAVFVVFRHAIYRVVRGSIIDIARLFVHNARRREIYRHSTELQTAIGVIVGTFPAVLVGLFLKDSIEHLFSTTVPVLVALAFTGLVLIGTFFVSRGEKRINPMRGFLIGIAQAMAIIPGVSRSGSTISAAMFMKIRREDAGEFSFLLAIPAISGATLLTIKDVVDTGIGRINWGTYLVGMLVSFAVGWASLLFLMRIVRRGRIGWFGFYCLAVVIVGALLVNRQSAEISSEQYMHVQSTEIISSYDGTPQKIRYLRANGNQQPLLIALHGWDADCSSEGAKEYFHQCEHRGWHCVVPNFRGPNVQPGATGSDAAIRDVIDTVDWAGDTMGIDHRRIFLVGKGGGGHMALLVAASSPTMWTSVSVWSPIADLSRWHGETLARRLTYSEQLENVCNGKPGESQYADAEYARRSPLTNLWRAHIVPMDINAGVHDGHTGSVPVGHSLRTFNALAKASGNGSNVVPEEIVEFIEAEGKVPSPYRAVNTVDPDYSRKIHLRRVAGLARLTIFEGEHEILPDASFSWFDSF